MKINNCNNELNLILNKDINTIKTSPILSCLYAKYIIKGHWQPATDHMIKGGIEAHGSLYFEYSAMILRSIK